MYYITLNCRGPKICRTTKQRQNRTLDIGKISHVKMTILAHNFSWILWFHAFSTKCSGLKPCLSSLFRPRRLQATFSSNMHHFWHNFSRYHKFSGFKAVIWWNFSQAVICQYSFSEPKMHRCTQFLGNMAISNTCSVWNGQFLLRLVLVQMGRKSEQVISHTVHHLNLTRRISYVPFTQHYLTPMQSRQTWTDLNLACMKLVSSCTAQVSADHTWEDQNPQQMSKTNRGFEEKRPYHGWDFSGLTV